jgi:hypothetical protein
MMKKIQRITFEDGPYVEDPVFVCRSDGIHLTAGRVHNPDGEFVGHVKRVFGDGEHSIHNKKNALSAMAQAKLDAKQRLSRAQIVDVKYPTESHCDQCDLQGVCCYLHGPKGKDCKAFPKVYRLTQKANS